MNKVVGLVVVALGAFLLLRVMLAGWFLFLLVAGALAIGTATGAIGRWGYSLAALFGLMAVPAVLFKTTFLALAMVVRLLPILLVGFGAYVLIKAFSK